MRGGHEQSPAVPRAAMSAQHRVVVWLLLVLGAVACAGGLALVASIGPVWREQQAYRRAVPCGARTGDCLAERDATVLGTGVRDAGRSRHAFALLDVDGVARPIEAGYAPGGTASAVAAAGRVRVVLWHGTVTRIVLPAGGVETLDSPEGAVAARATVGYLLASMGALLAYVGYVARDRTSLGLVTEPWPHPTAGFAIAAAVLSALVLALAGAWSLLIHPLLRVVLYAAGFLVLAVRVALIRRAAK